MATSSTLNWELTRNEIIEGALRKCQVLAKGQVPEAEDYTDCAIALNALIQSLVVDGMPLWKRTVVPITLVADQRDYALSNLVKVAQVIIKDSSSAVELEPRSIYDLNCLPLSTGKPVHFTFLPSLENGVLRVWPTPNTAEATQYTLDAIVQKEVFTFAASTDTPDFPVYYTETLIYGLASRIAPEYGVGIEDRRELERMFRILKEDAKGMGDDVGSFYFQPDRRG